MIQLGAMIDLNRVKTYSLSRRKSKVKKADFAQKCSKKGNFKAFYKSLPHILKAEDLRSVVNAIVAAKKKKKPVIFMSGAHVIKCGLSPLVKQASTSSA